MTPLSHASANDGWFSTLPAPATMFQSFRKLTTARPEISAIVLGCQTRETAFFELWIVFQSFGQLLVGKPAMTGRTTALVVHLCQQPHFYLLLKPCLKRLRNVQSAFNLHDQIVVQRNRIGTHLNLFYACKNTQFWKRSHFFPIIMLPIPTKKYCIVGISH